MHAKTQIKGGAETDPSVHLSINLHPWRMCVASNESDVKRITNLISYHLVGVNTFFNGETVSPISTSLVSESESEDIMITSGSNLRGTCLDNTINYGQTESDV